MSELIDAQPAAETGAGSVRRPGPDLFGRGMLYVLIWSMQMIVGVVVSPILAHTLGPAEFGSLAAAIALYQLLIVVSVFGLDQSLQIERAGSPDDRTARGLLAGGIVLALAVTGIAAATARSWSAAMGFPTDSQLVWVVLAWTASGGAVLMVLALLQSEDRLGWFAGVSVVSSVGGQVLGLLGMVLFGRSALVYAAGGVLSQFLALVLGLIVARPLFGRITDLPVLRRGLRLGLPLMLTGLSVFVLNVSDRLVTQRLLGAVEVGRFQVAYTIGYVIVLLLSFTNRAWIPRMAEIGDVDERWLVVRDSRDGILRLLMPAVLGITLAAPVLLRIVAPASFHPDSLLVVVFLVSLAAFPVTVAGASGRMLITLRSGRALAWSAGAAVAAKLALNIVLLPLIGIAGAAIATLLALSVQVLVQHAFLPKRLAPERPPWRLILACLSACAVAGATVALPQSMPWNVARFATGLLCLPWFFLRLRSLRSRLS